MSPPDVADTGNRYVRFLTTGNTVFEGDATDPMFMLVLDRPAGSQPINVTLAVNGGTASANLDYQFENKTITFQPGEQSKQVPLSLLNDSVVEAPETIKIAFVSVTGVIVQGTTTYELIIQDPEYLL